MKTLHSRMSKVYNAAQGIKDAIKNIWANGHESVPVNTPNTFKSPTWCCALMQLACSEDTTPDELDYHIARLKEENKLKFNTATRSSGETTIFVITTPYEKDLEKLLQSKGFQHIWSFKRRNGYPQTGQLRMWILNVCE